jgi:hypothetical protein
VKPIARSIAVGAPYYRVTLPSGRATVIRSWRASHSQRMLGLVGQLADQARAAQKRVSVLSDELTALGEAAQLEQVEALTTRIVAESQSATQYAEASVGHVIGAVWSDPGWALESWDDPAHVGNPVGLGGAVVAELDEAAWSQADIVRLAAAARVVLTGASLPDLQARIDALGADPESAETTAARLAAEQRARVESAASELADFSGAPQG